MAAVVWSWQFNGNGRSDEEAVAAPLTPVDDQYWQRLLKAVPVQAVAFITATNALAQGAPPELRTLALGAVFLFGGLIAWLEMRTQRKAPRLETGVALAAYIIWVYNLGGVFAALGVFQPVFAGLIAIGFAALLPFISKKSA